MSEVRMSLKEYDELKAKVDRCERILEALTTPAEFSEWDIEYYKGTPSSYIPAESSVKEMLTHSDYQYLCSLIEKKATETIKSQLLPKGIDVTFEYELSARLGSYRRVEPQDEE